MNLTFEHPSKYLKPNGGHYHYGAIHAARKKARLEALDKAMQFIADTQEFPTPTTYRIIWNHFGTIQPDDDNVVASIKAYKDGACQALRINDKDLRLRGVDFIRDKATKKTFTLILE